MTAVEDVRSRWRDPLPAHHQSAKPYLIGEATKSGVAGLQSGETWSRQGSSAELTGLRAGETMSMLGISDDKIVQQSTSLGSWFIHQRQANGLPAMSPQTLMELSEINPGSQVSEDKQASPGKALSTDSAACQAREEILTVDCVCPPLPCLNPYSARCRVVLHPLREAQWKTTPNIGLR